MTVQQAKSHQKLTKRILNRSNQKNLKFYVAKRAVVEGSLMGVY